jgi:hypothetical protein
MTGSTNEFESACSSLRRRSRNSFLLQVPPQHASFLWCMTGMPLHALRRSYLIVAFAAIVPFKGPSGEQVSVIDQGTLMISRNGTPIGRESYRILRSPAPGGQVLRATGQSAIGDDRVETTLGTDSLGLPVSYDSKLYQHGELVQHVGGKGRPGRFSVLVQTKGGESAREYVLNNGALLIDDNVFHQFYFVPVAVGHDHLLVISPRSNEQERFEVADLGADTLKISGRAIGARHHVLRGSDGQSREIWVDGQGRLLKVALPAKGLVALRDDLPR